MSEKMHTSCSQKKNFFHEKKYYMQDSSLAWLLLWWSVRSRLVCPANEKSKKKSETFSCFFLDTRLYFLFFAPCCFTWDLFYPFMRQPAPKRKIKIPKLVKVLLEKKNIYGEGTSEKKIHCGSTNKKPLIVSLIHPARKKKDAEAG